MQIGLFKLIAYKKAQFENELQFISKRLRLNNATLELTAASMGLSMRALPNQDIPIINQQQQVQRNAPYNPFHAGRGTSLYPHKIFKEIRRE